MRPKIFLSYATVDQIVARRLRTELEDRGAEVWMFDSAVKVGDSISEEIEKGLAAAAYVCLILTPNSVGRPWVLREYRAALHRQLERQPYRAAKQLLQVLPQLVLPHPLHLDNFFASEAPWLRVPGRLRRPRLPRFM